MIPSRELHELARAMMRTDECTSMMRCRSRIMSNPDLNQKVMAYEKERNRIMNGSPSELSSRLGRLFSENKALLEKEEIKHLINATEKYQKMLAECIDTLHKTMDSYMKRR